MVEIKTADVVSIADRSYATSAALVDGVAKSFPNPHFDAKDAGKVYGGTQTAGINAGVDNVIAMLNALKTAIDTCAGALKTDAAAYDHADQANRDNFNGVHAGDW